jgi:nitrogenase subunit NifH
MSHTVRFKLSNEEAKVAHVVVNSLRKQGHEISMEKFARQCMLAALNEIFRSAHEQEVAMAAKEVKEEATDEASNAPE